MTIFYTYTWRDGKAWLADIEPDVEYEIDNSGTDPDLIVEALRIDGVNILQSPKKSVKALAEEIKEAIENDNDWIAERLADDGYRYEGRDPMDPAGRWV